MAAASTAAVMPQKRDPMSAVISIVIVSIGIADLL